MKRLREIVVSTISPGPDKLWLRPKNEGGYDVFAMDNGSWAKVFGSGSNSGGLTEEEKKEIEKKISEAQATADAAKEAAEKAQEAIDGIQDSLELMDEKVKITSKEEHIGTTENVKEALELLAAKVWYSKIAIQNLAVSAGGKATTYEVGSTASAPTLTWKTTKTPTKTVCDGKTLDATATTYKSTADITSTKTITVTVTEAEGGTASASLTWTFAYAVYTGMAVYPDSVSDITQDWVKNTISGKTLKTAPKGDYTMKGSDSYEYWWFICPSVWTVDFTTKIGDGGATKVAEIADFVNDAGLTVPMTVYCADEVQGSDMTITIK